MRLIKVDTLTLEDFLGADIPKYAILSHTWEAEEVTFQDFPHHEIRSRKKGFHKIQKLCDLAKRDGFKYAWSDTCCIDKTSSSELTESINSMFRFYLEAEVCYAWLADLPEDNQDIHLHLHKCRWFTRGWTLQELIAPRVLEFYDQTWSFRGTKASLGPLITQITKISIEVLQDPTTLSQLPVAQKMSWAANRQTTRAEDMAYSLLGIFEVNMPMIYGEGSRAFLRLQEEIAKDKNDPSLFAWRATATAGNSKIQTHHGIFASMPADFRDSGSVQLINDPMFSTEFLISNKGLRIDTDLFPISNRVFFMNLNCVEPAAQTIPVNTANSASSINSAASQQHIGILIQTHGGGVYSRVKADRFGASPGGHPIRKIRVFLPKQVSPTRSLYLENLISYSFIFRNGLAPRNEGFPYTPLAYVPETEWDALQHKFPTYGRDEFSAYVYFKADSSLKNCSNFVVAFGSVKKGSEPWISISLAEDVSDHLGDVARVARVALENKKMTAKVKYDKMRQLGYYVHVSFTTARVDMETVHYIDLNFSNIPKPPKPVK
ncbi:HET domain protein [Trichoderma evansii]